MKTIPLTQGKVALVDDADFETASQFKWHAVRKGRGIYARHMQRKPHRRGASIYLHQLLMPGVPEIDHKDGNGLNNQRENIRPVSHMLNMRGFRTKQIGASSMFRGVSWDCNKRKWQAYINYNKKRIPLGRFESENEAARAYDLAAKKLFGEFACPNFP